MKQAHVTWIRPIAGRKYSFAYSRGDQATVPLNDTYKLAIGAGLAVTQDQQIAKECKDIFQSKRKDTLNAFAKAYKQVLRGQMIAINSHAEEALTVFWGYSPSEIESLKTTLAIEVRKD